ncbi:hypothetical protein F5X99DRAFT_408114 [Biscogniauxia marginata]|nr:hypothetical protein F5X99DRAFT_408114 [Biscogniauxia marginata]
MSQHSPVWSAQEELDLLIAVCRANGYFAKRVKRWTGVEEYLKSKGYNRTLIAFHTRFNRVIKRRINETPGDAGSYQVPCKTIGEKPLAFSIPSYLLDDTSFAADTEFPALPPAALAGLDMKAVKLANDADAAESQHAGGSVLPTEVGVVTLDGSYQVFLVNRTSLHGAKEVKYGNNTAAGPPSTPSGDILDALNGTSSLPFPDMANDPPPGSTHDPFYPLNSGFRPAAIYCGSHSPWYPSHEPRYMNPPILPHRTPQPPETPTRPSRYPRYPLFDPNLTPVRHEPSQFVGVEGDTSERHEVDNDFSWLQAPPDDEPLHLSPDRDRGSPSQVGRQGYNDLEQPNYLFYPMDGLPRGYGTKDD